MVKDDRTFGERLSDDIAKFGGSWKFIFTACALLTLWMGFNIFFAEWSFDPYPFILLNLVLSCVAAFQAPFILMSQHRAEIKQDEAYRALLFEIDDHVKSSITAIEHNQELEKRIGTRLIRIEELVRRLEEKVR